VPLGDHIKMSFTQFATNPDTSDVKDIDVFMLSEVHQSFVHLCEKSEPTQHNLMLFFSNFEGVISLKLDRKMYMY
jgi:hypothetical protein